MPLYQPERYKVHTGNGPSSGFCTVWNEVEAALRLAPELTERAAIIGTLYGRQGVSIIFRNLALNPQIHHLYIWGYGPLSQTKFGRTGTDLLFAAWKDGVMDDGTIVGTSFKLDSGCDVTVIRTILAKVQLVDLSAHPLKDAVAQITTEAKAPYMEPVLFPEPEKTAPERFASEGVGWLVRGRSVVEAWQRVVDRIMRYGLIKGTQYGMQQKELINVTWVIQEDDPYNPKLPENWPDELKSVTGAAREAILEYLPVMVSSEAQPGTSYTYGNRLKSYPLASGSLDQIRDGILASLKQSPDSRRTVATTIVPSIDTTSKEPPCLSLIQCLHAEGSLHLLATVRSHDIFKAGIPNAFGLRALQQEIAQELGWKAGSLVITSQSAHLYEADFDNAHKLIDCTFVEREPNLVFQAEDADPRGNVGIRLENDEIVIALTDSDGNELWSMKAKSARPIQAKIAQLELISQIGHALDIGMELAKAEIALKNGLTYAQDRPLTLPKS